MFSTIICDYHPSFKHLINLSVDQHASIDKLDAAIAASGTAAAAPRNGISGDTADTANCFKFSEAANDKLYNVLMLSTGGHAREIVMRVNDNDGRKVLFALRADALKQTEGQVQTLQSQILTTKLLANKHPAIFLDKLQRNCQELDSLLRLQDGSAFGEGQTKAAILNALPDEYKPFRISRDQHDKRGESVIALIITIVNHYIAYIEKAGGNTGQAGGVTASPLSKSARRRAARAKTKVAAADATPTSDKGKLSKGEKAKAKALAQSSDQSRDSPPDRDCIICKELEHPPSNLRHWFRDCPTLAKVRSTGDRADSNSQASGSSNRKPVGAARVEPYDIPDICRYQ